MGASTAGRSDRVAIVATGPSASAATADRFREAGIPILAVNDAWRICPSAFGLYAADFQWWCHYLPAIRAAGFGGRLYSCDGSRQPVPDPAITLLAHEKAGGLCKTPGKIYTGGKIGFSGAQAINLAYLLGFRRLVLSGFDMGKPTHFFGDHPPELKRDTPWPQMIAGLADMARDLAASGVMVVNASPRSSIPYWPRVTVDQALDVL